MKRIVRGDGREGLLEWTRRDGVLDYSLNKVSGSLRVAEVEPGVYSILHGDRSLEARVTKSPEGWQVDIGGCQYLWEIEDPREISASRNAAGAQGRKSLTSPMPGKVVRVLVAEGDVVEQGQGLVVVEAMKMQNEMKAPKSGKVVSLAARAGASVTAGEVLVTLE